MRSFGFICLALLLLAGITSGQTTPSAGNSQIEARSIPRDAQAIAILMQARTAAEGPMPPSLKDYTAIGEITVTNQEDAQGTVTIAAMGAEEFRMDTSLPAGQRSWAVHNGVLSMKTEDGAVTALNPRNTKSKYRYSPYLVPHFPGSLVLPFRQIGLMVRGVGSGLSYAGQTEVDGHTVHDIHYQEYFPSPPSAPQTSSIGPRPNPFNSRDLFIDCTTFQIVMMREVQVNNVVHEIHYSQYQTVNGISVPFEITDVMAGHRDWTIQVNKISFNSGLQAASFALQ